MKCIRIATWNINSIRIRMESIGRFVEDYSPDIVCFQETKTEDQFFPLTELCMLGYRYVEFSGEKSYNGVAVASKLPISLSTQQNCIFTGCENEKRHMCVYVPDIDLLLHNFYVPAGGYEPDPVANPKFLYKLQFMQQMQCFLGEGFTKQDRVMIVGDLNVAPEDNDVWSHNQMRKTVSHTDEEISLLVGVRNSLSFVDVARHFHALDEKLFTWWSYRSSDWKKSNRGRRLDHIWVTDPLVGSLHSYQQAVEMRSHERPSDHIPIIATLKL